MSKDAQVITLKKGWWQVERESTTVPIEFKKPVKSYGLGTKWLSTKEAAQELGVSIWAVYSYIKKNELKAVPKKKGFQVPATAIHEFRDLMAAKRRVS